MYVRMIGQCAWTSEDYRESLAGGRVTTPPTNFWQCGVVAAGELSQTIVPRLVVARGK